jgi:hypothetical protein
MTGLQDNTLEDDDLFALILSGAREGRHRDLRYRMLRVIEEAEYPKPEGEPGKDLEVRKPHPLIAGRHFVDLTGRPTGVFDKAWLGVVCYGIVESLLSGGDCFVWPESRTMYKIKSHCRISQEDLSYLQDLGKKL